MSKNTEINHPYVDQIKSFLEKEPNYEIKETGTINGQVRISITLFQIFKMGVYLDSNYLEKIEMISNPTFYPDDVKALKWYPEDLHQFIMDTGLDIIKIGAFYATDNDEQGNINGMVIMYPLYIDILTRKTFMEGMNVMARACHTFALHFENFAKGHTKQ